MLKLIFFGGIFIIASCSSKDQTKDEKMAIEIQIAQSYKYNLQQETYTIFNMQGDTTIHFHLTSQEKEQIIDKYYSLHLEELQGKHEIEDNCLVMPKLYTTLKVKSKEQEQETIIDESCDDYKGLFNSKGKRVATFLQFVTSLLKTKPEIKNAPTSDIMYL
jgi:hypothetical protein